MAHNLLTEPLIRFETPDGLERGSLPEVYAALMADRVESFPALRAHQEPAWHMFLAQLGAIACHRAGLSLPPVEVVGWQDIIGRLTRTSFPRDEPWCLIVEDFSKPAFLQPPVPEGVNWTDEASTADAVDMLSLSKNHDLKHGVALSAEWDDWIFSLTVQQTFDGTLTNNPKALQLGIARMNTGDGSRPFFGLAPCNTAGSISWGRHLCHDISVLTAAYSNPPPIWKALYDSTQPSETLIWIHDWADSHPLGFQKLDPLFIEVCRVLRLDKSGTETKVKRAGSPGRRIDSTTTKGVTGDPWAPINRTGDSPAVLTFSPSVIHYQRLSDILFDESAFEHPTCMDPGRIEAIPGNDLQIVIQGISRKRGHQTEKTYKRCVSVGRLTARAALGARRKQVKELAQQQIGEIEKIDVALTGAVGVFGRGGVYWRDVASDQKKSEGEKQRKRAQPYRDRLDAVADRDFFDALWKRFEAEQNGNADDAEAARRAFLLPLIDVARDLLEEGLADIPCPSIRRPRAEARARHWFRSQLRGDMTGFPGLLDDTKPDEREMTDAA